MFLDSHVRGYQLSSRDNLASLMTGFSGLPYSRRHWTLGEGELKLVHRSIALLEVLPVFGGLVALIERIVFFIREKWVGYKLLKVAFVKMERNFQKAIEEHRARARESLEVYASFDEVGMDARSSRRLTFKYSLASKQGPRKQMEDEHFYIERNEGIVTAVLDGHGGKEVAEYAGEQFKQRFFSKLKATGGNVYETFTSLINEIHDEVIAKHEDWCWIGSTLVISFIDKKTYRIYTATLGDSEANIYRRMRGGKLKSIPLSCVRDWSSKKDAKRASIYMGMPKIAEYWPMATETKELRLNGCLNVSRAIGDAHSVGSKERPGVIHKSKITVSYLKKGDILVLTCDGLKDYASEKSIVETLEKNIDNLAEELANLAIEGMGRLGDNISVIVIQVI